MFKKRRRKVTVVKNETFIISKSGAPVNARCTACAAEREMAAPEVAAVIAGVDQRTIYRWIESDFIHFTETQDNRLLVCLHSLPLTLTAAAGDEPKGLMF